MSIAPPITPDFDEGSNGFNLELTMGLLADLYVAVPETAIAFDTEPERFQPDVVSLKGFTALELSTLWAIILQQDWTTELCSRFSTVLAVDRGERLICHLPNEFLRDLTSVPDPRAEKVLSKWASTEELSCSADDVRPIWDALRHLAATAQNSGRGVFLWNCV